MTASFIHVETSAGEPVVAGNLALIPVVRSVRLWFPGLGGLLWSRPITVIIKSNGQEIFLPVRDITRQIQLAMFSLGLATFLLAWWVGSKSRYARR